ncbi:unnamed protein product [Tuber aestivum]|uniref:Uncharacterized protein n=1 Tax=Tuber aestivum TaxID=59557 RepID=A0A292PZU2_9PEZI|nr:unnamed protein product [Tuber aestivum]
MMATEKSEHFPLGMTGQPTQSIARPRGYTLATSQRRRVLSSEPETKVRESGAQSISDMPAMCPSNVCSYFPVFACHILIVWSAQLASHAPSGLNFTDETPILCPLSVYFSA